MLNFDELIIKIENLAYERFGDSREKNIYVGEAYEKVAGYFLDRVWGFQFEHVKKPDIDLLGCKDNQWYAIQVAERSDSDEVFPQRDLGDFIYATNDLKLSFPGLSMMLVLFECKPTKE